LYIPMMEDMPAQSEFRNGKSDSSGSG
jgi:hypothetical protein